MKCFPTTTSYHPRSHSKELLDRKLNFPTGVVSVRHTPVKKAGIEYYAGWKVSTAAEIEQVSIALLQVQQGSWTDQAVMPLLSTCLIEDVPFQRLPLAHVEDAFRFSVVIDRFAERIAEDVGRFLTVLEINWLYRIEDQLETCTALFELLKHMAHLKYLRMASKLDTRKQLINF